MTVKQQIIERILFLCEALKTAGDVKSVKRVTSPLLLTNKVLPSLEIVIFGENHKTDEEELQGYEMEFEVLFKFTVSHGSDPYGAAEPLVGKLQVAIESDLQLNGLANRIVYVGDEPFTNEVNKPLGGNMVAYKVHYRRRRANPSGNY